MPEAIILCPEVVVWLEKEGRNGYFRLQLPEQAQKGAPGMGAEKTEKPEKYTQAGPIQCP